MYEEEKLPEMFGVADPPMEKSMEKPMEKSSMQTLELVVEHRTHHFVLDNEDMTGTAQYSDYHQWQLVHQDNIPIAVKNVLNSERKILDDSLLSSGSCSVTDKKLSASTPASSTVFFELTPSLVFQILSDYKNGELSSTDTTIVFPQTYEGPDKPFEIQITDTAYHRGQKQIMSRKLIFEPVKTTFKDRINSRFNKFETDTLNKFDELQIKAKSTVAKLHEDMNAVHADMNTVRQLLMHTNESTQSLSDKYVQCMVKVDNNHKQTEEMCHDIVRAEMKTFVGIYKEEMFTMLKEERQYMINTCNELIKSSVGKLPQGEIAMNYLNAATAIAQRIDPS